MVKAEHLRKGYGDRMLIEDLSFTLPRGGIVGVIENLRAPRRAPAPAPAE